MTAGDVAAQRLKRSAFTVRVVAAVLIHFFAPAGLFAPDESTYDFRGQMLANYWSGVTAVAPVFRDESVGYYYVVGALYFPFGALPLLPKLLNAWIGSLAVLELFRLTRLIGGSESVALRAARFMAFFPSQILWSSLLVRVVLVSVDRAEYARCPSNNCYFQYRSDMTPYIYRRPEKFRLAGVARHDRVDRSRGGSGSIRPRPARHTRSRGLHAVSARDIVAACAHSG